MQVDGKGRRERVRKRGDGDIYAVFRSVQPERPKMAEGSAIKCNEVTNYGDVHACTEYGYV